MYLRARCVQTVRHRVLGMRTAQHGREALTWRNATSHHRNPPVITAPVLLLIRRAGPQNHGSNSVPSTRLARAHLLHQRSLPRFLRQHRPPSAAPATRYRPAPDPRPAGLRPWVTRLPVLAEPARGSTGNRPRTFILTMVRATRAEDRCCGVDIATQKCACYCWIS
jgi:hypothetical protein